MAIRRVLRYGTKSLREPSKEVHKVSKKISDLVQDLLETMYSNNGVGLAAPQIGENYRVFVIDVSTNEEKISPMVFINPKIIKKSGAMVSNEGCLSFPEAFVEVRRYNSVTVKALDINGKPFVVDAGEGTLLTRALQHEFDHLNGVLFIDHCINKSVANEELAKFDLPPVEEENLLEEPELEAALKND